MNRDKVVKLVESILESASFIFLITTLTLSFLMPDVMLWFGLYYLIVFFTVMSVYFYLLEEVDEK